MKVLYQNLNAEREAICVHEEEAKRIPNIRFTAERAIPHLQMREALSEVL